MPTTPSIITFEGLMVFHRSQLDGHYEVGILDARKPLQGPDHAHFFNIHIRPDPDTGEDKWVTLHDLYEKIKLGNNWRLEVVHKDTVNALEGRRIVANPVTPTNRHNPHSDQNELGWMLDVEQEFHKGELVTAPNMLKPILHLTSGRLYTHCKTDGISVKRFGVLDRFGFIAETVALGIETEEGEDILLSIHTDTAVEEVFRLRYVAGRSYRVKIMNVTEGSRESDTHEPQHFEIYYDLLFPEVSGDARFKLDLTNDPPEHSPNVCPPDDGPANIGDGSQQPHTEHPAASSHHDAASPTDQTRRTSVYPYKCGAIMLGKRTRSIS